MSVNSSSPISDVFSLFDCLHISEIVFISAAFTVTKVFLVLPLSVFVLFLGYQRWRQRPPFKPLSYCDFYTFQMAAIELISALGWAVLCSSSYTHLTLMTEVGFDVFVALFPGHVLFHVLTCVDRYLAVVHPVAYRGLKQSGSSRLRNLCAGCVWLLCVAWGGLTALYYPDLPLVPLLILLVLSLPVVSFCSVSVLSVLIRPGPGDVGQDGERVDQLKRKASCTITVIMAVLWLLFVGFIVCLGLTAASLLTYETWCVATSSAVWFDLPSSLVLLLLFLHRAGKRDLHV